MQETPQMDLDTSPTCFEGPRAGKWGLGTRGRKYTKLTINRPSGRYVKLLFCVTELPPSFGAHPSGGSKLWGITVLGFVYEVVAQGAKIRALTQGLRGPLNENQIINTHT